MTDGAGTPVGRSRSNIRLAVGAVCVGYGILIALRPTDQTALLARLIGAALVLLAVSFALRSHGLRAVWTDRAIAGLWFGVGLGAVVWPEPTVRGLAIAVGGALVAAGLLEIASVMTRATSRSLLVVGGATSILLGVTVVSWPTATTLVLAIAVGVRLVVAGAGLLIDREQTVPTHGMSDGRGSRWRVVGSVAGLVLASGVALVSVAVNRAQPDEPGAFYDAPSGRLGPPGTLIRSETIEPYLDGATTHRILYVTTDVDGLPITASGLVVAADAPAPPSGRPVLAFTHGTIGIARRCAPSLLPGEVYAPAIAGLGEFLAAGFAVVATDYAGLGSDATTGYLVGAAQAYATLDSVRAAQQIEDVDATSEFVTFGESQGGHAALFTGELAEGYAPELDLRGVAAAAPATNLTRLFVENAGTTFGDVLAAYALRSWSDVYDVSLDTVVDAQARPVVDRLAELCLQDEKQMLAVVPEAELLALRFLSAPPWQTEPWATILATNTPGSANIDAPVLIAQGAQDPLVVPEVQRAFVDDWCARGQAIEYRLLDGVGHLDAGRASASLVSRWAADRVADVPWVDGCENEN